MNCENSVLNVGIGVLNVGIQYANSENHEKNGHKDAVFGKKFVPLQQNHQISDL